MELDPLVRHVVGRADPGRPRVVVVELPRDERAVLRDAAANLDESRGAQVCPGELLLARPGDLDRPARDLGEARRLDRCVAGVLAAVRRTGVGYLHAHLLARDAESRGELVAHGERPLRAGPDGDPVAARRPFGALRARLAGVRALLEVLEDRGVRRLAGLLRPPRAFGERGDGELRGVRVGRDDAGEVAIADDSD